MKKFLVTMMLAITALSMIAEATARPMGGGRSFGRQSQPVRQMQRPAPAPAPTPAQQPQYGNQARPAPVPQPMPAQRPSMWKGVLGGALLGLGLGALFSHFGIGGAAASMISSLLMLALLAFAVIFIVRMFRRKDTPANPTPFQGFNRDPMPASATPEIGSGMNQQPWQPSSYSTTPEIGSGLNQGVALDKPAAHVPWGVPADFDTPSFLREAKSMFIRMQAAWDKGDVQDLREFTAPEVFAELKTQILERNANDFTDVVSIDAQLLGIEKSDRDYLASVQFNGMIRTAPGAAPEPFVEVWNLAKPLSGTSGWVLAGIQQVQ
ncbi:Tim44-like domain-containing protein [Massilia agilis]|uniref:Tim44-like domain-containing protein n=1 Tax=Massilia agilis TaxID=1811226 RepID=A0ABT2DE96_9BURK|nr:Tim44-like domain-containing protein [Massilia agilis]MCS0809453.1 Tim44-like domain-containing protein [Massilia agilis]